MKRETTNYALVGAFVVAMALALLFALFQLTGRGKVSDTYFADFTNIGGIKEGSLVTFEGHEIGRVGEISVQQTDGRTVYRLALNVKPEWQMPGGSTARRTATGFLAPLLIDIRAGHGSRLQPGTTIQADNSPIMMEAIADVAARLADITETGIEPLLKRVGDRIDRVGDRIETALPGLLNDLQKTLAQANRASHLLERALGEENQEHLTKLLANTEATTENFVQISRELKQTRARLDKLLDQSNGLIEANRDDVRASIQDIRASMQEVRQSLKRVSTILQHFESTGRNMSEFSRELRDDPSSLLRGTPPVDKTKVKRK
jgi:phospholipid/cholesterol/gamma-HCH transport system substrate-binding protein